MVKKKILLLVIFVFIANCGYQPLYITKDNMVFKEIVLSGNKKINRKIISLTRLKDNKKRNNAPVLKINSEKQRVVIAKDIAGNAAVYKVIIKSNFKIEKNKKILKEKTFEENSIFSKLENTSTFDLLQYQEILEENLINSISNQINIYLNSQ